MYRFNGYIHLKSIPGASRELVNEAGLYAVSYTHLDVYKRQVFNTAKMNGTFDYSTEGENNDKLAFNVSSAATREEGVEVSNCLLYTSTLHSTSRRMASRPRLHGVKRRFHSRR